MIRVIYNANARGGRVKRRKAALLRALESRVGEFEWVETASTEEGMAAAQSAEGDDIIVAIGGDGSVHTVVEGLWAGGCRASLGVIPLGTGNDFAWGMGIPTSIDAAVALLAAGPRRTVDLGWAELDDSSGFPFANAIGIGFDAAASIQSRKRKFLPGVLRYLVSSLETLARWEAPRASVVGEGLSWDDRLMFATFGNAPRSGGGFLITPSADPSDGRVDLCVVRELGVAKALAVIPRVMRGTHGDVDEAGLFSGMSFEMRIDRPVPVHADGEIVSTGCRRASISIRPGALRVVAPKR